MKTTVIIDESLKKGADWYNVTYQGKSLGINVKSNPKTIEAINNGAISVEMNVNPSKDGSKYFGFDLNESSPKGGGSRFNPEFEERKQKMIIAQSSISTAAQYYQQRLSNNSEDIFLLAEKIYNWVIEKAK